MASQSVPATPLILIGRDQTLAAELEQSLEAAIFADSCRAAYEWALTMVEHGFPQDVILRVIALNAVGRRAVD